MASDPVPQPVMNTPSAFNQPQSLPKPIQNTPVTPTVQSNVKPAPVEVEVRQQTEASPKTPVEGRGVLSPTAVAELQPQGPVSPRVTPNLSLLDEIGDVAGALINPSIGASQLVQAGEQLLAEHGVPLGFLAPSKPVPSFKEIALEDLTSTTNLANQITSTTGLPGKFEARTLELAAQTAAAVPLAQQAAQTGIKFLTGKDVSNIPIQPGAGTLVGAYGVGAAAHAAVASAAPLVPQVVPAVTQAANELGQSTLLGQVGAVPVLGPTLSSVSDFLTPIPGNVVNAIGGVQVPASILGPLAATLPIPATISAIEGSGEGTTLAELAAQTTHAFGPTGVIQAAAEPITTFLAENGALASRTLPLVAGGALIALPAAYTGLKAAQGTVQAGGTTSEAEKAFTETAGGNLLIAGASALGFASGNNPVSVQARGPSSEGLEVRQVTGLTVAQQDVLNPLRESEVPVSYSVNIEPTTRTFVTQDFYINPVTHAVDLPSEPGGVAAPLNPSLDANYESVRSIVVGNSQGNVLMAESGVAKIEPYDVTGRSFITALPSGQYALVSGREVGGSLLGASGPAGEDLVKSTNLLTFNPSTSSVLKTIPNPQLFNELERTVYGYSPRLDLASLEPIPGTQAQTTLSVAGEAVPGTSVDLNAPQLTLFRVTMTPAATTPGETFQSIFNVNSEGEAVLAAPEPSSVVSGKISAIELVGKQGDVENELQIPPVKTVSSNFAAKLAFESPLTAPVSGSTLPKSTVGTLGVPLIDVSPPDAIVNAAAGNPNYVFAPAGSDTLTFITGEQAAAIRGLPSLPSNPGLEVLQERGNEIANILGIESPEVRVGNIASDEPAIGQYLKESNVINLAPDVPQGGAMSFTSSGQLQVTKPEEALLHEELHAFVEQRNVQVPDIFTPQEHEAAAVLGYPVGLENKEIFVKQLTEGLTATPESLSTSVPADLSSVFNSASTRLVTIPGEAVTVPIVVPVLFLGSQQNQIQTVKPQQNFVVSQALIQKQGVSPVIDFSQNLRSSEEKQFKPFEALVPQESTLTNSAVLTQFAIATGTSTETSVPFNPFNYPVIPVKKPAAGKIKKKELEQPGFIVEVRKKGKFEQIFPAALPLGQALFEGVQFVRTHIAATFKEVPTGKPAGLSAGIPSLTLAQVKEQFQTPAKGSKLNAPLTFIQPRGERLASRQERLEIKAARFLKGK